MMRSSNTITLLQIIILFCLVAFTFFYKFSSYPLENINEGLYAEIAREMLVTGHYALPQLNFVPYLEKPPLLYWLIAISYHLFGVTTFAARLIPVLSGALTCLIIFLFSKKIDIPRTHLQSVNYTRAGWFAAIILATSAGFILISRVIIFDMSLTLFFSLALLFFYLWYENDKKLYLRLCYLNAAMAFMVKGMLAPVLIAAIILFFMIGNRIFRRIPLISGKNNEISSMIQPIFDFIGIAIFFSITFSWILMAAFKQPGFIHEFFINQQMLRFLDKCIPRDYHRGTIFYYILPLLIILMPWTFSLPLLFKKSVTENQKLHQLTLFLWLWFLIPFIFFSISQAKGAYYIIIGIPALALLLGLKFDEYASIEKSDILLKIFVFQSLIFCVFLTLIYFSQTHAAFGNLFPANWIFPIAYKKPFLIILLITFCYSMTVALCSYVFRWKVSNNFLTIAFLIIPWVFFMLHDKYRLIPVRSEALLINYILQAHPEYPVYLYKDYEDISTTLFFLKKRISIIDSKSADLYFGSTTSQAKDWFISSNDFVKQVKNKNVYVVMKNRNIAEFLRKVSPLHFCVAAKSGRVTAMASC